jgi:WD40 repeat protein
MAKVSRPWIARVVCAVSLLAAPACAPSLRERSLVEPLDSPDAIVAVGGAGEIVYAVTRNRELRAWDWETRKLRTLERTGAVGIARDGAIALRATDTTIDAWDPSSGKLIATKRFEHGFQARAVSRLTAYVVAYRAQVQWPGNATGAPRADAQPPEDRDLVSWNLASGMIDYPFLGWTWSTKRCNNLWLSVDGARTLCDLAWRDRPGVDWAPSPELAPDWAPPEPEETHSRPSWHDPGHELLSVWLAADGLTAYVTYSRTVGGDGWRLDRWTPDTTGKTAGRLDHLVVSHEPIADSVVAASADGQTILTSSGARPPVLRHAPSYEGVPLLAPPVTAAVFCHDDQAIVTGHADGRLRLWTAKSGQFRAISPK